MRTLFNPSKSMTVVSFILFLINAVALVIFGKKLSPYSALPKLDFHLAGYDAALVQQLFTEYGEAGRGVYFWLTVLDTPFPFVVAFFGICYFSYTWRAWSYPMVWRVLIAASYGFCVFDVVENALIYRFLATFPNISPVGVAICSISTQVKLISLLTIYLAAPVTLLVSLLRRFRPA